MLTACYAALPAKFQMAARLPKMTESDVVWKQVQPNFLLAPINLHKIVFFDPCSQNGNRIKLVGKMVEITLLPVDRLKGKWLQCQLLMPIKLSLFRWTPSSLALYKNNNKISVISKTQESYLYVEIWHWSAEWLFCGIAGIGDTRQVWGWETGVDQTVCFFMPFWQFLYECWLLLPICNESQT